MRLRTELLVFFLIMGTILTGAVVLSFHESAQSEIDTHRESVEHRAETIANSIDGEFTQLQKTLELRATNPSFPVSDPTAQQPSLRQFVRQTRFGGASIVAADGMMVGAMIDDPVTKAQLVGISYQNRTYFDQAMAGETYISRPIETTGNHTLVVISTPIYRNDTVVGTLNGAVHLEAIQLFHTVESAVDQRQGVRLTASDGTVLYEQPAHQTRTMTQVREPLSANGWTVRLASSPQLMTEDLAKIRNQQLVALFLVFLLIGGFWTTFYWRYIKHHETLLEGLKALRNKEYEYRIDATPSGDWGDLIEGFNDAARTLSSYEAERERRISELTETRRKLEQNTEYLTVLDRVFRHNINNSMTVIEGFAEQIRREATDPTEAYAETILDNSQNLRQTVDKQRQITEFLSEPQTVEQVDIAAVLDNVASTVCRRYPNATVRVEKPDQCRVLAVRGISQAVTELVENGVTHSDQPNPMVRVVITERPDAFELIVADDGPGIPEMERKVLTGEAEIHPLYHGSGLGLWLVNLIVEQSDGELAFSERDPRGSVVHLTLPRA